MPFGASQTLPVLAALLAGEHNCMPAGAALLGASLSHPISPCAELFERRFDSNKHEMGEGLTRQQQQQHAVAAGAGARRAPAAPAGGLFR